MHTVWAQRREEVVRDCLVSPDVFTQMVDRLGEFVVPYQHALETEASWRHVHLYLQGLLSHLERKNAEKIASFVDVERQVIQDFIGTASWDHRPLITVLVRQVAERLGEPDGIIAFDPSSFPKRGTHSVGVKRHLHTTMPCWTSGCPCPRSGYGTNNAAKPAMCRQGRGRRPKAPWLSMVDWRRGLDTEAWTHLTVRDGEKGPVEIEMVKRRVQTRIERKRTGPQEWLVITRRPLAASRPLEPKASPDATDQDTRYRYQYYLTPTASSGVAFEEPSLGELARVIKAGVCIEASFQRGKGEVGMDEYQVRTWQGWHHRIALSLMAVWFLLGKTHRGQQWTPALTLPQVRYGLSLLLLEVCCTPGIDSICCQVQRQLQRNESARFYHHRTRKVCATA